MNQRIVSHRIFLLAACLTFASFSKANKNDSARALFFEFSTPIMYSNLQLPDNLPSLPPNAEIMRFVSGYAMSLGYRHKYFSHALSLRGWQSGFNQDKVRSDGSLHHNATGFDYQLGYEWHLAEDEDSYLRVSTGIGLTYYRELNFTRIASVSPDQIYSQGVFTSLSSRATDWYLPIAFRYGSAWRKGSQFYFHYALKAYLPLTGRNKVLGKTQFFGLEVGVSRFIFRK